MKEAKKAIKAMIELNRSYLMVAYNNGDEEYMKAFSQMMEVLRRLEDESS